MVDNRLLSYIISSRVRLARNLRNYQFIDVAQNDDRKAVVACVRQAIADAEWFPQVACVAIDDLSPLERRVLEEKRLISHFFASHGSQRLAIIANSSAFSILVNEEDHLRIQAVQPGLQLKNAWKTTMHLERTLHKKLDFAYSHQDGYLTTCSSNKGTGMRVSVMLFLPGLILLKQITPVLQKLNALGYIVRGSYGEGSQSVGYALQVSKQDVGRHKEREAFRRLKQICSAIVTEERRCRMQILRSGRADLAGTVAQLRHTISTADHIGLQKGTKILAVLRFATTLQIEGDRTEKRSGKLSRHLSFLKQLDALMISIQPAHVLQYGRQHAFQGCSDTLDRSEQVFGDALRAKMIQREMGILS